MKDDVLLALILGAGLSALSIVGNFVIADPHTLRVFPFALLLLLVPAVVFWAARRREAGGASSDQVRVFGVRVGVIAGATFAVATGLLSGYWFGWSSPFGAFGASVAFISVLVLSVVAAVMAGYRRQKAI